MPKKRRGHTGQTKLFPARGNYLNSLGKLQIGRKFRINTPWCNSRHPVFLLSSRRSKTNPSPSSFLFYSHITAKSSYSHLLRTVNNLGPYKYNPSLMTEFKILEICPASFQNSISCSFLQWDKFSAKRNLLSPFCVRSSSF